MLGLLWKIYWKLSGWKVAGEFPHHYKKMILLVAPHTSWKDILVGFAARNQLKIYHAKFLGKKVLFDGPFGWLFRKLGGTPVDRSSNHGMVDQAAALFTSNETFLLAMAPEGTRKRVDKLRSGFYHIAKQAQVPILPVGLDFENKQLVLGQPLFTTEDEAADLKKIIAFFAQIKGANPGFDLRHLKDFN
ncbi:1-acyl-sn-glycerol-3-phosphate acyltransferase [Ferruginibacter sp.]|nr:acyltransferase [Ferruginibacter sp.]